MAQEIAVGIIVALAVAYVLWRVLPAAWRKRVHPALAGDSGCGGGCGGCAKAASSCAAGGPAKQP